MRRIQPLYNGDLASVIWESGGCPTLHRFNFTSKVRYPRSENGFTESDHLVIASSVTFAHCALPVLATIDSEVDRLFDRLGPS